MITYYRILGVLILIACIILAIIFYGKADLRSVTTDNDFINSMLHSPHMLAFADGIKVCLTLFMIFAGLGIGSFCFGIGQILDRLKNLRS